MVGDRWAKLLTAIDIAIIQQCGVRNGLEKNAEHGRVCVTHLNFQHG